MGHLRKVESICGLALVTSAPRPSQAHGSVQWVVGLPVIVLSAWPKGPGGNLGLLSPLCMEKGNNPSSKWTWQCLQDD